MQEPKGISRRLCALRHMPVLFYNLFFFTISKETVTVHRELFSIKAFYMKHIWQTFLPYYICKRYFSGTHGALPAYTGQNYSLSKRHIKLIFRFMILFLGDCNRSICFNAQKTQTHLIHISYGLFVQHFIPT